MSNQTTDPNLQGSTEDPPVPWSDPAIQQAMAWRDGDKPDDYLGSYDQTITED